MDTLTKRLHDAADEMQVGMPAAEQIRHSAEHARRTRRAVAGSIAAGMLAVFALGIGVLNGGALPQFAPAGPASPAWAPPAGSVFTADPLMPKVGWVAIISGEFDTVRDLKAPRARALGDDERVVMTTDSPRPLACITSPYSLRADEAHGAALLQPGRQPGAVPQNGRLNEYVLWFADPSDAARAVAVLREEFQECRSRPDATSRVDHSYLAYDEAVNPPIDEQFTGKITRVPKNGGGDDHAYGLSVARRGSLVVVHESMDAWFERPGLALYALMDYALDRTSPTVAPAR